MTDANIVFLISLTIIFIGYLLKRVNIITEENGDVIAKLIFNITLPSVILSVISETNLDTSLLLIPLIHILYGILMAFLGLLLFRNHPRNIKGLLIMSIVGFNVTHFSFPLVEGIWGAEGMKYIALVDAGNAFTVFILCYILGSVYSPNNEDNNGSKINFKKIISKLKKSVPIWSYLIAISINLSGIEMPIFFTNLVGILARANTALSLLLLGTFLNFKFEKSEWKIMLKSLFMRYGIGLLIGISLFFILLNFSFPELFRKILAISLVLPMGLAVIPYSVELNYNKKLITMISNLCILISFSLVWILVLVLNG